MLDRGIIVHFSSFDMNKSNKNDKIINAFGSLSLWIQVFLESHGLGSARLRNKKKTTSRIFILWYNNQLFFSAES